MPRHAAWIERERILPRDVLSQPSCAAAPGSDQTHRRPGAAEQLVQRIGVGACGDAPGRPPERRRVTGADQGLAFDPGAGRDAVQPDRMRGHMEQRPGNIGLEHTGVYPEDVGGPPTGLVDICESYL